MNTDASFSPPPPPPSSYDPNANYTPPAVPQSTSTLQSIRQAVAQVFVGQDEVVHQVLAALLAGGHVLLEGKPGLGKTHLVLALSRTFGGAFRRIQFTPDLMPSDVTGHTLFDLGSQTFRVRRGPVFANLLLADEINRAPAKTQSAMLEAMQENKVTVLGKTYPLPSPFFVLATQNPIEQEGTYPLPEAQLDRFMFLIEVDYPSLEEETRIARETTGGHATPLEKLIDGPKILACQQLVRRLPVPEHVYQAAVRLVRKTRPGQADTPAWVNDSVAWGAGPRAVQYLVLGAKSRAALRGSYMASLEDLEAIAPAVLNHRVITNFNAESQGMNSKKIVERLIREARE